ncbi:unnamed protein product [Fraxinus pennsylvanica]|uniref:Uncharacterized protein n=1 Tax=Fraxinus pennsylvanica TaxID=56036 RepID=A0AAD1YPZ4_9LAMI|nr:unnamed protein product [Fraxinus pennsylvanica]
MQHPIDSTSPYYQYYQTHLHNSSYPVWLLNSILYSGKPDDASYGDGPVSPPSGCNNCTIYQHPCHHQPPPPSRCQSHDTLPPPVVQGNCPPAPTTPIQCCQYAPPMPFYSPCNNYSDRVLCNFR